MHKYKSETKQRLHYVVGIVNVKIHGECVIIVDESDEVMFKNLKTFWRYINYEDRRVICLTAAADDKYEKGVEQQALEAMDFAIFRNSHIKDLKTPRIHMEVDLSDENKVLQMIDEQRENRGVLIYANSETISKLEVMEDYVLVKEETTDEKLREMGKKVNGKYPVYLISKKYGLRGLDYRSPGNLLGICLFILASCNSDREFL